MRTRKRLCLPLALLILIPSILPACQAQAPSASAHMNASDKIPAITMSVPPSPLPSIPSTHTASSPAPSVSPAETNTAPTNPTFTPKPSTGFDVNNFTAGDGQTIYYFADDGIRRMDVDGTNDLKTKISNCVRFIYLDSTGLYYLADDHEYKADHTEETQMENCYAYDLMMYNTKTYKTATIRTHLYDVDAADKKIYMIDHLDHKRILLYNTVNRKLTEVEGYPVSDGQYYDAYLNAVNDVAYFCMGDSSYPISNDSIATNAVQVPYPAEITGAYPITYNEFEKDVSLWTGTEYKVTTIKGISGFQYDGTTVYVISEEIIGMDEETRHIALYRINPDGKAAIISEVTKVMDSEENLYSEIIGSWFFSFRMWHPAVEGLVFMERIS